MPLLIRKDPVAARWVASRIEQEVGHLTDGDKRLAVDIMERHNPAVAAGLRDLWDL